MFRHNGRLIHEARHNRGVLRTEKFCLEALPFQGIGTGSKQGVIYFNCFREVAAAVEGIGQALLRKCRSSPRKHKEKY